MVRREVAREREVDLRGVVKEREVATVNKVVEDITITAVDITITAVDMEKANTKNRVYVVYNRKINENSFQPYAPIPTLLVAKSIFSPAIFDIGYSA